MSFPSGSAGKESTCNETWVWFLGWEDSPREGHVNPLQYSCLENPIDRGAWWVTIHEGRKELDMTEVTKHAQGLTNVILLIIFCCFVVALLVYFFLFFFLMWSSFSRHIPTELAWSHIICSEVWASATKVMRVCVWNISVWQPRARDAPWESSIKWWA